MQCDIVILQSCKIVTIVPVLKITAIEKRHFAEAQ